jgi:phosphatidate phosphatase APP1
MPLIPAARTLEERWDRFRWMLKRSLGRLGPLDLMAYRSCGTTQEWRVRARLVERLWVQPASVTDSRRKNFLNMMRRFHTDEVPGARVRLRAGGFETEVETDLEGFVDASLPVPHGCQPGWHDITLEVLEPVSKEPVQAVACVLVPGNAAFAVVSDLDDTVIRSNATRLWAMLKTALFENALTRDAFDGVAELYAALQKGALSDSPGGPNPIVYVSSSPWNIYDLLTEFLEVNGIPSGPLFLKDWSPTTLRRHESHKGKIIRELMNLYTMPFVLIGDSGERDPEIYASIALEQPNRVRAVLIRHVSTPQRATTVQELARGVMAAGVPMFLVRDSFEAARHAADLGLIAPETLPMIETARVGM